MTLFVQLHLLTAYPPANLNRDDTGRPKTAQFGGAMRLRISSQALKRAWRESDVFAGRLAGQLGKRTQRMGEAVEKHLIDSGVAREKAQKIAVEVARCFGKLQNDKDKHPTLVEQLVFISPEERERSFQLAERIARGDKVALKDAVDDVLHSVDGAADVAMFGRMLTDEKENNKIVAKRAQFSREAAVQVAHAITTHRAIVEDDYFTAMDDLNEFVPDAGAAHVNEAGFGAGLFYLYACVNRDLLVRNLGGDEELAGRGIAALVEAAATVAPRGKQASFASRARASFVLAEKGGTAPRTLAAAFLRPVGGEREPDHLAASVERLTDTRKDFATAYGEDGGEFEMMDLHVPGKPVGTLDRVIEFAAKPA